MCKYIKGYLNFTLLVYMYTYEQCILMLVHYKLYIQNTYCGNLVYLWKVYLFSIPL